MDVERFFSEEFFYKIFSKLEQLKTLIYVSCDPHAATKNFVDLCRPMSCKFDGQPFKIVAIQPVDLFPMTRHLEWIVKFERC